MDELRASANLGNAPSTVGVGSTRRTLFTSDVVASRDAEVSGTAPLEKELEQVRNEKAAAVRSENYRLAHQLKLREKDLLEVMERAKGLTGAGNSGVAAVLAHAEGTRAPDKRQEGAAKPQEGARMAVDGPNQSGQSKKELTGIGLCQNPVVLGHVGGRFGGAKAQE